MKIKQVKNSQITAENLTVEDKLPLFPEIQRELRPGIELKHEANIKKNGEKTEIELFGYFDHQDFIRKYGGDSFCCFLEKLQEITDSRLILNTRGEDYTITIYDDYME